MNGKQVLKMGLNGDEWKQFHDLCIKANDLQIVEMCNMLLDMNDARIKRMQGSCEACLGRGVYHDDMVCPQCNGVGYAIR